MSRCPCCNHPIKFSTIFLAVYPVWITCAICKAKLVGDRFIKIQGFLMIPEIAALSAAAIIFTHTPDIIKALLVFAGVFIIALPNAIVALKWGRYRRV